ncbi:MAG: sugar phosphate isomerase/epimerase family protein [Planctomycetota bacterium]
MKVGITFYSFHQLLTDGKTTLEECIDFCAREKVETVDILAYYLKDAHAEIPGIRRKLESAGLELAAYGVGNNLCLEDAAKRTENVEMIRTGIDVAAQFQAPLMRVFGGFPDKEQPLERSLSLAVEGLRAVAGHAEKRKVILALENHGRCPGTSAETLDVIRRVGSPAIKPLIDTGNFLGADQQPLDGVRELAPTCVHVHVKDYLLTDTYVDSDTFCHRSRTGKTIFRGVRAVGEGSVDLVAAFRILADAGYSGSLAIEHEGPDPSFEAVAASIRHTRKCRDAAVRR